MKGGVAGVREQDVKQRGVGGPWTRGTDGVEVSSGEEDRGEGVIGTACVGEGFQVGSDG